MDHPESKQDPLQVFYLHGDLVCEYSILALILRASTSMQATLNGVTDECTLIARETLSIHEKCMRNIRDYKNDTSMITKYMNWCDGLISYKSLTLQESTFDGY